MPVMTTNDMREHRNVDEFKSEFRKYSDAARGIFLIRTREPQRCLDALQDMTIDDGTIFRVWKSTTGWKEFPQIVAGQEVPPDVDIRKPKDADVVPGSIDIAKALPAMYRMGNGPMPPTGIYAMFYPHSHFEKLLVQQHLKDFAHFALENGHRCVLLVPEVAKLPPELEDDAQILDFKPPSHIELVEAYEVMTKVFETFEDEARPEFNDEEVDEIVQNAVGMTIAEFEQAISIAALGFASEVAEVLKEQAENPDHEIELPACTVERFVRVILDQKVEVLKQTNMLELMHPGNMGEVGGFDLLKGWLRKRQRAYTKEAAAYGIEAPKAVMCAGPPGSGKSLFAKASAGVFNVPLIKFDTGKVYNKYVGDSEANIRAGLKLVDAMAPCVLLIDEVDKQFANSGGGDSGTSQRVLGTFLTWMQERDSRKAPVFIVMTANNVLNLPAELTRKGRIDEIFACTFPAENERAEILKIHLNKRGHNLPDHDIAKVVKATPQFVGAELESIVVEALLDAFEEGKESPTVEHLMVHANSITPLAKSQEDRVQAMNAWASANAKPASTGMSFDVKDPSKPVTATGRALNLRPLPKGPARPGKKLDN